MEKLKRRSICKKITVADLVVKLTFEKMYEQWMRNFAQNMNSILNGKDIKELPKFNGEPCIIVGAGPSIQKFKLLDQLKEWKGTLICCDKMLVPLLKRDITPVAVTTVDGSPLIRRFYNHMLVRKKRKDVRAVFCCQTVHPKVVETCALEKYWFVAYWDDPFKMTSLTRTFHLMTGKTIMKTGGNAGACCFHVAYFLGCDPIGLVGLDYSYLTNDLRKTPYFETFKILSKGDPQKMKKYFFRAKTWAGYEVFTDLMFITYLQMLIPDLENAKSKIYNLSPLSIIKSKKVNEMQLEGFIRTFNRK